MIPFKKFISESNKVLRDAGKIERQLKRSGIDYYIDDSGIGFIAFEIEDVPGMKIVVDGVGIKVTERGEELFYGDFSLSSIDKAITIVEEG